MSDTGTLPSLSPDDKKKLDHTIEAGLRVKQEVEDLTTGLKEQVKALAEEFGIKPAPIMEAINTIFKNKFADKKAAASLVEEIIVLTGHA